MKELSLFSGAGGGLLGTKLLGWTHCGYVEYNDYCQRVIAQRIKDGILDEAPIFGDIRAFLSEGYAESYQGMVDVITAGFPCQPFSVAGKQRGADDERNMWPQTLAVIRAVRPKFALLENVPGLLAHEYIRRIFGGLAESGFDARWTVLGADDCGALHRRKRLWIYAANNYGQRRRLQQELTECETATNFNDNGTQESLADTKSPECDRLGAEQGRKSDGSADSSQNLSYARCSRSQRQGRPIIRERETPERKRETNFYFTNTGWRTEPNVGRVANGVASRVDRLKALGNGQVSAVVRAAWRILSGE